MAESATAEAPPKKKFGGPQEGSGRPKGSILPGTLLSAMRHVFEHNKRRDKSEAQRKCRAFYERDPNKFLERLNWLENQHREMNEASQDRAAQKLREASGMESAVDMDEGEERVRELLGLLKALYREKGYQ